MSYRKLFLAILLGSISVMASAQAPKVLEQVKEKVVMWDQIRPDSNFRTGVNQLNYDNAPAYIRWKSTAPDTTAQHFVSSIGLVSAEVDHSHYADAGVASDYSFTLEVIHYDLDFNKTVENIVLRAQHDPEKNGNQVLDKDVKVYYNTAYLQVKVLSIYDNKTAQTTSNPNDNFVIRGRIETERYYDFDYAFKCASTWNTATTFEYDAVHNAFLITRPSCTDDWDATDWELEWTYVDNYQDSTSARLPTSAINYDFSKNATRVRLPMSTSEYLISNVFEEGYLLIRMRYVGRKGSQFDQYYEGNWYPAQTSGTVDGHSTHLQQQITSARAHENTEKTWQYVASYAEEGKNKEVVSYYDGLNKNRQAVTRLSTDGLTVAGETVYDYQGRPAVQILPVPVNDKGVLQFYDGINTDSTGSPYHADDFDGKNAEILDSTTAGASSYYSENNAFDGIHQDYIPTAKGYPFTQTEFTKDGTGRVRKQSGVGPNHQLGSDHAIQYIYSKPSQEMLVRLFGTEVGEVSHYKESIVIDANGQASVSYIDQHGRVIVTSLAGKSPSNLHELDTHIDTAGAELVVRDLHSMNLPRIEGASPSVYELSYPFYAIDSTKYKFWYEFQPEAFVLTCNNICFDCHYNLEITITTEAGDTVAQRDTVVQPNGSIDLSNAQQSKLKLWPGDSLENSEFTIGLAQGKYTIRKRLELDESHFEDYWTLYVQSDSSCLLLFDDFLDDAYEYTIDCDSVGSGVYEKDTLHPQCRQIYEDMLKDVSPGGQYGAYELSGVFFGPKGEITQTEFETHFEEVSVFSDDNVLSTFYNRSVSSATWKHPYSFYKTITGDTAYVTLDTTNTRVTPDEIPREQFEKFIYSFKRSWAPSLIRFHPEYGAYDACRTFESSLFFDDELLATETYADALAAGYIGSDDEAILTEDPLYQAALGNIDSLKSILDSILASDPAAAVSFSPLDISDYRNLESSLKSVIAPKILGIAYPIKDKAASVACAQIQQSGKNCGNPKNFGDSMLRDEQLNKQWAAYRAAYVGSKRKVFEDFVEEYAKMWSYNLVGFVHDPTGFNLVHGTTSTGKELFDDKQVRFGRTATLLGIDIYSDDADAVNTVALDSVNAKMEAWKTSRCSSYIALWLQELSSCGATDAFKDSIIGGFIEVCEAGYDQNNPLGASTVPVATTNGYTSFQDVLVSVLGSTEAGNNYCNHLLINMPPAYNHPFRPGDALKKGDIDCGCEQLQGMAQEVEKRTFSESECLEWEEYPSVNYAEGISYLLNDLENYSKLGNYPGDFIDLIAPAYDNTRTHLLPYLTNSAADTFQAEVTVGNGNMIIHLRKKNDHSVAQNIVLYNYSIAYTGIDFSNVVPARTSIQSTQRFEVTAKPTLGASVVLKGYAPGLEHLLYMEPGSRRCIRKSITKSAIVRDIIGKAALDITEEEFYSLLYSCKNRGYNTDFYDFGASDSMYCSSTGGYLSQPEDYCEEYPYIDPIEKWFAKFMNEMAGHSGLGRNPNFGNTDSVAYGCTPPRSTSYLPDRFTSYRKVLAAVYYPANNFEQDTLPAHVTMDNFLWGGYISYKCDIDSSRECYIGLGALNDATRDTFSLGANTIDKIDSVFNYRYDQGLNKYLVDVLDNLGNTYTLETYNCRQEYCDYPRYTYSQMEAGGKDYGVNCDEVNKAPLLRFLNALTATTGAVDLLNTTEVDVTTYNGYKEDCNSLYRSSALSLHDYVALNAPMSESPTMGDTLLARLGDTNQVPAYFTFYMTDTSTMDWDQIVGFRHLEYDTAELVHAIKNGYSTHAATFYFTVWALNTNGDSVLIKGYNTSYSMGNCFQVSIPNVTEEIILPPSIRKMCPSCLSCDTVAMALNDFYNDHPSLGYNHGHHDKMLTNYLNARYGNNWYSHEYQDFFDECDLIDKVNSRRNACSYSFQIANAQRVDAYNAITAYQDSLRDTTGYTFSFTRDSLSAGSNSYCFNLWSLKSGMLPVVQGQLQSLYTTHTGTGASSDPLLNDTISIAWPRTAATGACRQSFRELFIDTLTAHFPSAYFDSTASFRNRVGAFGAAEWITYSLEPRGLSAAQRYNLRQRIDALLSGCSGYEYRKAFYQYSQNENYLTDTLCTARSTGGTGCESCNDIRLVVRDFSPSKELQAQYGYEAMLAAELQAQSQLNYQVSVQKNDCEDCNKEVVYVCNELSTEATQLEAFLHACAQNQELSNGSTLTYSLSGLGEFTETDLYGSATSHSPSFKSEKISEDTLYITLTDTVGFLSWIGLYHPQGENLDFTHISKFQNLRLAPTKKGRNNRFVIDAYDSINDTWRILEGYTHLYTIAKCCEFKQRQACYKPRYRQIEGEQVPCDTIRDYQAHIIALRKYMDYLDKEKTDIAAAYRYKCSEAYESEIFELQGPQLQHHFTLYYYDIAGNLVRTVPPQGVGLIAQADYVGKSMELTASLWRGKTYGASKQVYSASPPSYQLTDHQLSTFYQYNTLNEVTRQLTPDGGESQFYYDRLGRLVFSQNARQAEEGHVYSYTRYDGLGRISEVGEMALGTAISASTLKSDTTYFLSTYNAGVRSEITKTQYDSPLNDDADSAFANGGQTYLRNRVAATYYTENEGVDYSYASHYSYDVHGNVKTVLHEYKELAQFNQQYKRIDYDYDLVSGNVHKVRYQEGQPDQFYHQYQYDADNRITAARTSKDNMLWESDARYEYYLHGPLARVILGENQVQGIDYAYTLHGWLKGVNSELLDKTKDIGRDGHTNHQVAQDAFGFTLGYYKGDYRAVNSSASQANHFIAIRDSVGFGSRKDNKDLFNGNISHMATANRAMVSHGKGVLGMNYTYDQLNRIKSSESFVKKGSTGNTWVDVNDANIYSTSYNYDGNGNIMALKRFGYHDADTLMDDLEYHYYPNSNQLKYVEDQASAADDYFSTTNGGVEDLNSGQSAAGNYYYDAIGNLVQDKQEGIKNIDWSVYGKVRKVERADTVGTPDMEFKYDASGNRIVKIVKPMASPISWKYTYYARDAQGNVMAVYNLQNGLEDSVYNVSLITNWLVDQYGLEAVKGMFNDAYGGHTSFLNELITQVINSGFAPTVMDAYPLEDYLNIHHNVPADLVISYHNDSTDFYAIIDSFIRRYRSTIAHFYTYRGGNDNEKLLYQMLKTTPNNNFLNCFTVAELEQVYTALFTSAPPSIKADLVDSLTSMGDDNIWTMATMLMGPNIEHYYDSCATHWQLRQAFGAELKLSQRRILLLLSLGLRPYLVDFFTGDGDADPSRPMDLLKQYGTHEYLLTEMADMHSDNFINNAIPSPNQHILDATLENLDWFTLPTYLQLIRESYGDGVLDSLIEALGSSLIYRQKMQLAEHHIYGSSRLGIQQDTISLYTMRFKADSVDINNGHFYRSDTLGFYLATTDTVLLSRVLSNKKYELSNHLGNVLAVVSDKRIYLQDTVLGTDTFALWDPYIASAQDYYPFGMLMPNRVYTDTPLTEQIVIAVQTIERVVTTHEFANSTEGWLGTTNAVKHAETDRLRVEAAAQDDWLYYKFDTDIGEDYRFVVTVTEGSCDSMKIRVQEVPNVLIEERIVGTGTYEFEFTATTVQTRMRIGRYDANKQGTLNYYIDRVVLKRSYDTLVQDTIHVATGNGYRYAFNGQERDDEVNGVGNSYTAMYWHYDSRLGRRWNIDPVVKEHESPYATFANNPIWFMDPNGADSVKVNGNWFWQIESDDTYYSIGQRTGVDYLSLEKWNNQDATNLKIGSLISIEDINAHFVYEDGTPTIYNTTVNALEGHPEWAQLHYLGAPSKNPQAASEKTRNRRAAKKNCVNCIAGKESKDEFPYASTFEGGSAAVCECTPVEEQLIQAGELSSLYRGMDRGEAFLVVPVSSDLQPEPVPEPVPVPQPRPAPAPAPTMPPAIIVYPRTNSPVLSPGGSPAFFLIVVPWFILVEPSEWTSRPDIN